MAAHSVSAMNPDQFNELVGLCTALSNQIKAGVEKAYEDFNRILVTTDTIFVDESEYKESASELVKMMKDIIDNSAIDETIKSFTTNAQNIADRIGVTVRKNTENLEAAIASFNAEVKKAGEAVGN